MLKLSLHNHTHYDPVGFGIPGFNIPEEIEKWARKNNMYTQIVGKNQYRWAKYHPKVKKSGFIINGVELMFSPGTEIIISDSDYKKIEELARDKRFPLMNNPPLKKLKISPEEGLDILRKEYCVECIIAPHPFWSTGIVKTGYEDLAEKMDALEVYNADLGLVPRVNKEAKMLALKLGIPGVAGRDSYFPHGRDVCYNIVDATCREDIHAMIKEGRVQPVINRKQLPLLLPETLFFTLSVCKGVFTEREKIYTIPFISSLTKQLY